MFFSDRPPALPTRYSTSANPAPAEEFVPLPHRVCPCPSPGGAHVVGLHAAPVPTAPTFYDRDPAVTEWELALDGRGTE